MIPVLILNFDIVSKDGFNLGKAAGSSLRGALYAALGAMYDTHRSIASADDFDENPVAWLLRLEKDDMTGGKDVPRPLAIRPPLEPSRDKLTFGISFYGRAIETIPMVVSAIPLMGTFGIGRGRARFEVREVRVLDVLSGQEQVLMDAQGNPVNPLPEALDASAYQRLSQTLAPNRLQLRFHTPTRIIEKGQLSHTPLFAPLFQRLIERIRTMSEVYAEKPLWLAFDELLSPAREVKLLRDQTHWVESWSGSRRDGMMKPLGGYVGDAYYEGDFAPLLPYLLLGQGLQVGKNTIKGCGWYEVIYQWQ